MSVPGHIQFREVSVRFGASGQVRRSVIEGLNLEIQPSEFITIVGPSGCGKSTVLNLVLGSLFPSSGEVRVAGQAVEHVGPDRGIVYQKYGLYPHCTVLENVAIGPILHQTNLPQRIFHTPAYWKARSEASIEAKRLLTAVGLSESDYAKYPPQLSGGMQQRVAIAQSLMMAPPVLLMDEPFGALDPKTRESTQQLIVSEQLENRTTVLFVTHDIEEAVYLGNRVLVFGRTGDKGANVILDRRIEAPHPRPPQIKYSSEFNRIQEEIRAHGLGSA